MHSSHHVETTYVFGNRFFFKVVYTYNEILFSLKKEWNSAECDKDKPWRQFAKWNKLITEEQLVQDSTKSMATVLVSIL